LHLSSEKPASRFAFSKCNLPPLHVEEARRREAEWAAMEEDEVIDDIVIIIVPAPAPRPRWGCMYKLNSVYP
jgi:hypothetical protein